MCSLQTKIDVLQLWITCSPDQRLSQGTNKKQNGLMVLIVNWHWTPSKKKNLRCCPQPKDQAAINERRKEFSQNQSPSLGNQRYHAEVEERFAKYKAGLMR